jgi:SNF2 family DNA or RNA helicase
MIIVLFCNAPQAFVQRQGYDYVRLDGSTPQKLRQGICDEFNSRRSIFLFLMSTVAGGLGLNLTAANKVVRPSQGSHEL